MEFDSEGELQAALGLDGTIVDGQTIKVTNFKLYFPLVCQFFYALALLTGELIGRWTWRRSVGVVRAAETVEEVAVEVATTTAEEDSAALRPELVVVVLEEGVVGGNLPTTTLALEEGATDQGPVTGALATAASGEEGVDLGLLMADQAVAVGVWVSNTTTRVKGVLTMRGSVIPVFPPSSTPTPTGTPTPTTLMVVMLMDHRMGEVTVDRGMGDHLPEKGSRGGGGGR